LGLLAFIVILAPLSVAALDALGIEAVSKPAKLIIERVSSLLPNFLGASVIIGISIFIGGIISNLAEELLTGVDFASVPEKLGLNVSNISPTQTPSKIGGRQHAGHDRSLCHFFLADWESRLRLPSVGADVMQRNEFWIATSNSESVTI